MFSSHTWRADHKCDSDRRAAWTFTQCTVKAEEQRSLFKSTSKNYDGEAAKFVGLSWFCRIDKQTKLAEQWNDAHLIGKSKRDDEHLVVIRGSTRSASAGRRQARVEKVEFGQCQSSMESSVGIEGEYRLRHMGYQPEVHHESRGGRTPAYTTLHKMRLG